MDVGQIVEALKTGGGYGIAAVMIWLYVDERKHTRKLQGDILQYAIKSTEASVAVSASLASMKDVITMRKDY